MALCQQPGWNLLPFISPVPERLWLRNLLQLWESVNLTSVGLKNQNSVGLTPHLIRNLKHSARSARAPSAWAHLVWKHWCHTQNRKKHQLASKSHTITHISTLPFVASSWSKFIQFCSSQTLRRLTARRHSNHLRLNSDVESRGVLDFEQWVCVGVFVCFTHTHTHTHPRTHQSYYSWLK